MPELTDKVLAHIKPKIKASTAKQYAIVGRLLKNSLAEFAPAQVPP
jgi:hypothetical protein